MKSQTLTHLVQLGGLAHLGLICAGLALPRIANFRQHTQTLPVFLRKLFWVYYSFIGLCLIGFGTISVTLAPQLTSGSPLARGFCAFLVLFWTLRLVVAFFVLDVGPFLINTPRRIGYHLLNITFIALPIIYLLAAL